MITIIISVITIICLIIGIIKFPTFKIGKKEFQSFYTIPLIGVVLLILTGQIGVNEIVPLMRSQIVNPIEILILFISVTIISIVLDEAGFFSYLASKTASICKNSQKKLFFTIYSLVSVLTIFTSNDIIILTFTPFICMLSKRMKINPIPYLFSEFVAANTWSMMLMVGNPTNLFLSLTYNIDFLDYFKVMFLPTVAAGLTSLVLLYVLFRKSLNEPINVVDIESPLVNKGLIKIGLVHLITCIILLAIANFINIDMWLICLVIALLLISITAFKDYRIAISSIKKAPFSLIPFILSMFIIVLTLDMHGVTENVRHFLDSLGNQSTGSKIMVYGYFSIILDNLINNIPMSLASIKILGQSDLAVVYSVIIGSNLGACLTPIGALAGIMWMSILKKEKVELSFVDFMDYGFIIVPLTALVSFLVLLLVI